MFCRKKMYQIYEIEIIGISFFSKLNFTCNVFFYVTCYCYLIVWRPLNLSILAISWLPQTIHVGQTNGDQKPKKSCFAETHICTREKGTFWQSMRGVMGFRISLASFSWRHPQTNHVGSTNNDHTNIWRKKKKNRKNVFFL